MNDPVLGYVALSTLVVIMVLGASSKLRSLGEFEVAVAGYRLLPPSATALFSVVFASMELVSGLLLLAPGRLRMVGAVCTGAVIALATLAMATNLVRGHTDIDCGCGALSGASGGGLTWWLVARNVGLMMLAAVVGVVAGMPRGDLTWSDAVTFFGATLALLGLYLVLTQLAGSHVRMRRNRA